MLFFAIIGPLHDPVTWHGINYAGTQVTQWENGKSGWTDQYEFLCFGSPTVASQHNLFRTMCPDRAKSLLR